MRSRVRKAALEEKAISDEYIPVAVMDAGWQAIGANLRTNYLRVPSLLAAKFSTLDSPQKLFQCAMDEINQVLEILNKSDGSELNYLFADAPGEDEKNEAES